MPALSQSLRVKGSREVSVVRDLDLAFIPSRSGSASAARGAALHTLASSFQAMPAISQPGLVKGWRALTASAIHTFAFSSQAISALLQSIRVKGWMEKPWHAPDWPGQC